MEKSLIYYLYYDVPSVSASIHYLKYYITAFFRFILIYNIRNYFTTGQERTDQIWWSDKHKLDNRNP